MSAKKFLEKIGIYNLDTKKRYLEVIKWMEEYAEQYWKGELFEDEINYVVNSNEKRFLTNTTHIICSKCGGDSSVNNSKLLPFKTEIVVGNLIRIEFTCPICGETYEIGMSKIS